MDVYVSCEANRDKGDGACMGRVMKGEAGSNKVFHP